MLRLILTKRPHGRFALVAALMLVSSPFAACGSATPTTDGAIDRPHSSIETNAVVERVIDGDTFVAVIDRTEAHVRLIGIDTPETKKPGAPVECFGAEASARLHDLLPEGSPVRLERDEEPQDTYGRVLAYAYLPDGTFVNLDMVEHGLAAPLVIEPNTAHVAELGDAARQARTERRGLWGACAGPHAPLPS